MKRIDWLKALVWLAVLVFCTTIWGAILVVAGIIP